MFTSYPILCPLSFGPSFPLIYFFRGFFLRSCVPEPVLCWTRWHMIKWWSNNFHKIQTYFAPTLSAPVHNMNRLMHSDKCLFYSVWITCYYVIYKCTHLLFIYLNGTLYNYMYIWIPTANRTELSLWQLCVQQEEGNNWPHWML